MTTRRVYLAGPVARCDFSPTARRGAPRQVVDTNALASLPGFERAPPAALTALAARAVERRFEADEVLFRAGTRPGGLFVLLSGQVRVLRGASGRQHVIHREGPGGTLGEVPLFAGGGYPATAVAAEPTRCAWLSEAALREAVRCEPDVAFLLLGRLAARVRHLVQRLDDRSTRSVTGRLAEYLLREARGADGDRVSLGMTQTALAEELGTVREVVVRGLVALRRQGIVRQAGAGRYVIVDRGRLERAALE